MRKIGQEYRAEELEAIAKARQRWIGIKLVPARVDQKTVLLIRSGTDKAERIEYFLRRHEEGSNRRSLDPEPMI